MVESYRLPRPFMALPSLSWLSSCVKVKEEKKRGEKGRKLHPINSAVKMYKLLHHEYEIKHGVFSKYDPGTTSAPTSSGDFSSSSKASHSVLVIPWDNSSFHPVGSLNR
ncbi:hypothetical protein BJX96DRAFT_93236 [Aspergillus floccosus]